MEGTGEARLKSLYKSNCGPSYSRQTTWKMARGKTGSEEENGKEAAVPTARQTTTTPLLSICFLLEPSVTTALPPPPASAHRQLQG
jgi:hypothetical protein